MLDFVRKSIVKSFYRNFRKKKWHPGNIDPSIASITNNTVESRDLNDEHLIFVELDCVISKNEIIDAIKRLKEESQTILTF